MTSRRSHTHGRVSPSAAFLTVREILGNPRFGLELVAGGAGMERSVRCQRIMRLGDPGRTPLGDDRECLSALTREGLTWVCQHERGRMDRLLQELLGRRAAAIIVSRRLRLPEALLRAVDAAGLPLLATREPLTKCISRLTFFLRNRLGAEITVHGVLMDVFGVGLLILGPSGIGKSESALELVTRGHRLVADDMVVVHRAEDRAIVGSGSGLARFHMEVRGLGIIDIKALFGIAAARLSKEIELIVELEEWRAEAFHDRLGLTDAVTHILDIPIPHLRIPVSPGRNISVILEVAARNHLLKRQGHHSAQELDRLLRREHLGGQG